MKIIKYLLVMTIVFTTIIITAKTLAQRDGILHDPTLVKRHWKA